MKFVGLGGGIGSGKSTVGALLARRGADVIDVDQLSRHVQRAGTPVFDQIVQRWGNEVVAADGELDRTALGRIVFADADELAVLTGEITGPAIEAELLLRARAHLGTGDVVVLEAATILGGEHRTYGMEGVIHVDVPEEAAIGRVVEQRGMPEAEARARAAQQLPRSVRVVHADFVIDNSGTLVDLEHEVEQAWTWIGGLPDAIPVGRSR